MSVDVVRRRFTVDEYLHMAEVGILTERDRVELLDGEIVETTAMPTWNPATCCSSSRSRTHRSGATASSSFPPMHVPGFRSTGSWMSRKRWSSATLDRAPLTTRL